jgi:hypothetical protein
MAVAEVAAIEQALRIHDLSRYTADAPGQANLGVMLVPQSALEGAD